MCECVCVCDALAHISLSTNVARTAKALLVQLLMDAVFARCHDTGFYRDLSVDTRFLPLSVTLNPPLSLSLLPSV